MGSETLLFLPIFFTSKLKAIGCFKCFFRASSLEFLGGGLSLYLSNNYFPDHIGI
jgi:hypothetical protein